MQKVTIKQWIALSITCIGVLALIMFQAFGIHQILKVSFLDVGQGDAIFIQTSEHHNVLIDAGPDSKVVDQLSRQMGFFDKTIDIFILTHPHADHYGGILSVMQKYKIQRVVLTGVTSKDPAYLVFLDRAKEENIEIIFAKNNQDLQIGPNLYLDVLYPLKNQSLVGQSVHNKNNTSMAVRLLRYASDGQESLAVLTGDAEHEEEREILLSGQVVKADILKLGHHGSKTATSDGFLRAVDPDTTVVSVGTDNKFSHPHVETMEKVKGLKVYRTDLYGTIGLDM